MPTLYDNFERVKNYIEENNTSYVSKSELANCSYVTSSDLPVINENIIPKETTTYTLGDSSYKYNKVYSSRFIGGLSGDIYNASNLIINIGNEDKYRISSDTIRPYSSNTNASLGTSDYKWAASYSYSVYTNDVIGFNSNDYTSPGDLSLTADGMYITTADQLEIIADSGIIFKGNITPEVNNSYSIGTSVLLLNKIYSTELNVGNNSKVYNDSGGITFSVNNNNGIRIGSNAIYPKINKGYSLGSSSNLFNVSYTYISYITNNNYIRDVSNQGLYFSRNSQDIVKIMAGGGNIGLQPCANNARYLGMSGAQWAYTYTRNLILDGTDINDIMVSKTADQEISGQIYFSYYTINNQNFGIKSYSHIIGGDQDRTSVTFLATQRKCGASATAEGTSYMAAFFTNSDGRSKFTHKSYTNKANIGGESDDAFLCFNAYGFKLAYSGVQGTAASTEYEILHEGNIGNLSYTTTSAVNGMFNYDSSTGTLTITTIS